jgi:alpha-amylase
MLSCHVLLCCGLKSPVSAQPTPDSRLTDYQRPERSTSARIRNVPQVNTKVHLFEWTWKDVALECETVLGPAGVDSVQISPPQEHRLMPGRPWYQRYQPVSYQLESRGGTRQEFEEMVRRCNAAGVAVISDAVINHMAQTLPQNQSEAGSAGSQYRRYYYPGLFSYADFHHCGRYGDNVIRNYQDRWEVQTCELVGLADLNTGSDAVQSTIANFLNEQLRLGVKGFRIDAAKHISTTDLAGIIGKLNKPSYVFQEVIDQGGEPISAREYLGNGAVTEFRVGLALGNLFRRGNLSALESMGEAWGYIPSEKAVVFTDNHDNQRGHGGGGWVLTFRDGLLHRLANMFLLAFNYGSVSLMSSYDFNDDSDGPPSSPDGNTLRVYADDGSSRCGKFGWVCEHRQPEILSMVEFRNSVGNASVTNWWNSSQGGTIAFSRQNKGWFALNIEPKPVRVRVQTTVPDGSYCDLISKNKKTEDEGASACSGQVIVVSGGFVEATVPAMSAIAIVTER